MVKKTIAQIRKELEERRKASELRFIPQEGTTTRVYVFPGDPEEVPEGEYTFYMFRVKVDDKEKSWRIFDNNVLDLDDALKSHPDRIVTVSRAKGTKKIIIT